VAQRCLSHLEPAVPPLPPRLADQPSRFIQLEREVEQEYRPRMLESLQGKVDSVSIVLDIPDLASDLRLKEPLDKQANIKPRLV
jgi:hypothetical protein